MHVKRLHLTHRPVLLAGLLAIAAVTAVAGTLLRDAPEGPLPHDAATLEREQAAESADVAALNARIAVTTDDADALELMRQVEARKRETQHRLLGIPEETADRLDDLPPPLIRQAPPAEPEGR